MQRKTWITTALVSAGLLGLCVLCLTSLSKWARSHTEKGI